jgi:hypothetical protein
LLPIHCHLPARAQIGAGYGVGTGSMRATRARSKGVLSTPFSMPTYDSSMELPFSFRRPRMRCHPDASRMHTWPEVQDVDLDDERA